MLTFPQARARLVAAALKSLGRDGIVSALLDLGYHLGADDFFCSDRSLAYRLAWRLLPAGGLYVAPAAADLSWYAAQSRADARAEPKGGA
jgi:hypothetical protein